MDKTIGCCCKSGFLSARLYCISCGSRNSGRGGGLSQEGGGGREAAIVSAQNFKKIGMVSIGSCRISGNPVPLSPPESTTVYTVSCYYY